MKKWRSKLRFFLVSLCILGGCVHTRPTSHYTGDATMRPYRINGRTYYPTIASIGDTFRGIASWYGEEFHGKMTSCGERYDMHELTAAHKTLPMNTLVKVTNQNNSKSVVVRINDRGPFVQNRIIDLSYAAARRLDVVEFGTAPVIVEVLGFQQELHASNETNSVILNNFAVQVGAFHRLEGAQITKDYYRAKFTQYHTLIRHFTIQDKSLYRVWIAGFRSEQEARDFIAMGSFDGAFIVRE
ncbi:MAG: septal ring lytic transglycosylase RlpA family protein [bacterium]